MVQPVDPRSRDPKWFQVAEQIRAEIASGQLPQGSYLPSYDDLAYASDTSIPTVRRAIQSLELEELVVTEQGVRAQVAIPRERTMEHIKPGDRLIYRPATPDEQRKLGLPEGADVAEVTSADGAVHVYVPRAVEFMVADSES